MFVVGDQIPCLHQHFRENLAQKHTIPAGTSFQGCIELRCQPDEGGNIFELSQQKGIQFRGQS